MRTDITVIVARARMAPVKIVRRLYFIAIIAAMKNVLSPISETRITESDDRNPWSKPSLKIHENDFCLRVIKHLLRNLGDLEL